MGRAETGREEMVCRAELAARVVGKISVGCAPRARLLLLGIEELRRPVGLAVPEPLRALASVTAGWAAKVRPSIGTGLLMGGSMYSRSESAKELARVLAGGLALLLGSSTSRSNSASAVGPPESEESVSSNVMDARSPWIPPRPPSSQVLCLAAARSSSLSGANSSESPVRSLAIGKMFSFHLLTMRIIDLVPAWRPSRIRRQ